MWLWSPDFALVLTERDGEGLDPAAGPSGPEPGSRGAKLRTDQDLGRGRGGPGRSQLGAGSCRNLEPFSVPRTMSRRTCLSVPRRAGWGFLPGRLLGDFGERDCSPPRPCYMCVCALCACVLSRNPQPCASSSLGLSASPPHASHH